MLNISVVVGLLIICIGNGLLQTLEKIFQFMKIPYDLNVYVYTLTVKPTLKLPK